ncbi:MAG: T9SS type A sorting domain-containing protein [Bacteroidetes bacterium]|nr:MAG: T9SS type A sorting domain-containing protein [Bacteroidota bacterium]
MDSRFLAPLIVFSSLFSVNLSAQKAPGGVDDYSVWALDGNKLPVSNYRALDLVEDFLDLNPEDFNFGKTSTLFFVLKPRTSGSSDLYLKSGDISIYGDRIQHGRVSTPLTFHQDRPVIIAIEIQRSSRYSLRANQELRLGDSTLFSLAEMIVYTGVLSRVDRRKISSNLALKYGLPITENESPKWRDYIASSNRLYWDTRIDRLYANRVLALGASRHEDFWQTQTLSETDWDICLALDFIADQGDMPDVYVADGSFIVFSEKSEEESLLWSCENLHETHPLHDWKFHIQDWNSPAQSVLVRVPRVGKQEDSLFVTDGSQMFFAPQVNISLNTITYEVALSPLQNDIHYFFTNRTTQDCLDSIYQVQGNDVNVVAPVQNGTFQIQSLGSGFVESVNLMDGKASVSRSEGQYLVSLQDSAGNEYASKVLYVRNESPGAQVDFDMRLYPNPLGSGQTATLEINNLPSEEDLTITVTDAMGRVLQSESVLHASHIKYMLTEYVPGLYTVVVRQGERLYTLKFVVQTAE